MNDYLKTFRQPGPVFVALLLVYLALVLLFVRPLLLGDAFGYTAYAYRMIGGSPPACDLPAYADYARRMIGSTGLQGLRLWWGPGYPLALVPFAAAGGAWFAAKLLNAGLLLGAVFYIWRLLLLYLPERTALTTAVVFDLYPPFLRALSTVSPETLTLFLACGMLFHLSAAYRLNRVHLYIAALFFGYLILTKVFFAYVAMAGLAITIPLSLNRRARTTASGARLICALALAIGSPYLLYTYSVTGKPFYWGTSGGMSLYWMSSDSPGELGSWFSREDVFRRSELARHRAFFSTLENLQDYERDDAFRRRAIDNIRRNPRNYLKNIAANVGRLLFSYPFSFGFQTLTTYLYLLPNMFLVVLVVLTLPGAVLRRKMIPIEVLIVMAFALIAFCGSALLSAYDRQFRPLVPCVAFWTVYCWGRIYHLRLKPSPEQVRAQRASRTALTIL